MFKLLVFLFVHKICYFMSLAPHEILTNVGNSHMFERQNPKAKPFGVDSIALELISFGGMFLYKLETQSHFLS